MPPYRDLLSPDEMRKLQKTPRLWEDLLTGLSLAIFITLFLCVVIGAWLYESGI